MKLIINNATLAKVRHACHDIECENARCKPVRFMAEPSAEWHHGNPFRYERTVMAWTCSFCESCVPGSLSVCDICDTPAGPASIPVRVYL